MNAAVRQAAFRPNWAARAGWLLLAAYVLYAAQILDLSWARFVLGLGQGERFLSRLFPPDFHRWPLLLDGLVESLQIAVIASALGILASLPLGLLAARNLMPWWVSTPTRAFIALCRSFHPILVAIVFVKAIGFGALAGILALMVASLGFVAKLFAEAIEEISMKQVEAVRATGASFAGVVIMGVLPQVIARFIGFSTYQLDSNLRNSTMVGIVGGGGIGGTLFAAFQRFDYGFLCAILLAIIALIMVGEVVAARLRAMFQ
ncbi:MAG TPA: phosphonate ABC transporter, permease protein PhnE [Azospirillum sp.]|nr:phosphonate ABC transporter, permease protein PhnE [Azospirillum sp.]